MAHDLLMVIAGVLFLGIVCQWVAWRMKMPAILPLLAVGFIAGPMVGWLHPQEMLGDLFFPAVSFLVAIILFEGALTLEWREVRSVASTVRNLITVGALVTWIGGAATAHYVMGLSWALSVLFGALIVVTGPTVIAPLLRNVRPTASVASVLKWEGILIDPLGALLAVLVFDFIVAEGASGAARAETVWIFLRIVGSGTAIGLIGGLIVAQIVKRYLVPDYLRDVTVLSLVGLAFAVSDTYQSESGLLAVTVMGIFLANSGIHQLREVWYFKEKLSVLFISVLFIVLAASIQMADLRLLDWRALVLLGVVMLVLRPVGIYLSAWGSSLSQRERIFLSWIAPRGIVAAAVSALFAFRLKELNFDQANILEPLVFLIIVGTVVLQGFTAKALAKGLGVAEAEPQGFLILGAHPLTIMLAETLKAAKFGVRLIDLNRANVVQARLHGLEAYEGNILSEFTETDIDLSGLGRLLAMTSNDEANALACLHLQDEFGSSETYQLVPKAMDTRRDVQSPSRYRLSRLLFSKQASYETLLHMVEEGAQVKRTSLTQKFTFRDFQGQQTGRYIPLLAYRNTEVMLATVEDEFAPQPGWTLISLVLEPKAVAAEPEKRNPDQRVPLPM